MRLFKWLSPRKPHAYEYRPDVAKLNFQEGIRRLEKRGYRVIPYGVDSYSPGIVAQLRAGLEREGIPISDYQLDVARFREYQERAGYTQRHPEYYGTKMTEKQLEHFVTLDLLGLRPSDIFMDVASESSPVPEIYERLVGATTYWQDIQYAPGVHGRQIGGDACDMPIPSGFATAVAVTCSIEHFESDADGRLCDELGRVVQPGGRLVIAPLYMSPQHAVQTDPIYGAQIDVPFDEGATIYAQEGWNNRHGRFYSPATLKQRVISRLAPAFDVTVKAIQGTEALEDFTYLRFALLGVRR